MLPPFSLSMSPGVDDGSGPLPLENEQQATSSIAGLRDSVAEAQEAVRKLHPVYLSQSFFATSKVIRQNCGCFLLFNLNKKERRMISSSCSDLEPDAFNSMFDGLPRYNFVMIDNEPSDEFSWSLA